MLVWLVTIGEPLPVQEGAKDRPHRTGLFARLLAERGHDVVWWTSTYDHFRKKQLFADDHVLSVNSRLEIRLLHGCGYRSNVSLARFRDHRQVADRFAAAARAESRRPDIIVAALPTIELCLESTRYGKQFGVPVIAEVILIRSAGMGHLMNKYIRSNLVPTHIMQKLLKAPDKEKASIEIFRELVKGLKDICQGIHIVPFGAEDRVGTYLNTLR